MNCNEFSLLIDCRKSVFDGFLTGFATTDDSDKLLEFVFLRFPYAPLIYLPIIHYNKRKNTCQPFTWHKKTQTTNTYNMLKLSFKRRLAFLFCLPLLFAACNHKNATLSQPLSQEIEREFPQRVPNPAPIEEPSESKTPASDPEIWDVSDVDISHIDPSRKLISFTFDDAPKRTLENILAVFASFNENNPDCPASAE